ncbi:mediator of RNA polymerase II transcription subunit 31, partial [Lecanoromycetidae sp. Uapishka_2]
MANTATNQPPTSPPPFSPDPNEPLYGGYTRFELELEFVTLLSSPLYMNHLASLKLLQDPAFIAYLKYLQYWTRPEYIKYLNYPGPTLRALELLQQERFRADVLSPDVVNAVAREGVERAVEYQSR